MKGIGVFPRVNVSLPRTEDSVDMFLPEADENVPNVMDLLNRVASGSVCVEQISTIHSSSSQMSLAEPGSFSVPQSAFTSAAPSALPSARGPTLETILDVLPPEMKLPVIPAEESDVEQQEAPTQPQTARTDMTVSDKDGAEQLVWG